MLLRAGAVADNPRCSICREAVLGSMETPPPAAAASEAVTTVAIPAAPAEDYAERDTQASPSDVRGARLAPLG